MGIDQFDIDPSGHCLYWRKASWLDLCGQFIISFVDVSCRYWRRRSACEPSQLISGCSLAIVFVFGS